MGKPELTESSCSQRAMELAVSMEMHCALSTTTRAKAEAIDAAFPDYDVLADTVRTSEREFLLEIALKDREALIADLVGALEALHHAVCGETGFANAVRLNSGLAYPWPALDIAEEKVIAALSLAKTAEG